MVEPTNTEVQIGVESEQDDSTSKGESVKIGSE